MNTLEMESLYGQSAFLFKLYAYGIRRHMDYATGIVGRKRKISYQSLIEAMEVQSSRGVTVETPTKSKLQRAIKKLTRLGLLKPVSSSERLVFRCLLATQDTQAQNKPDTIAIPNHPLPDMEADIGQSRSSFGKLRSVEASTNKLDTEADTLKKQSTPEADTPPLSVTKKKDITNVISKKEICVLPDWLDPKDWEDFIQHRKSIKKPITALAQKRALNDLEKLKKLGYAPSAVINQSIVRSWTGLFPVNSQGESHYATRPSINRPQKHTEAFAEYLYGKPPKGRLFDA